MLKIDRDCVLAALVIALISSLLLFLPQFERLRGLSIDMLTWLKWTAMGPLHDPLRSPTVVIALDQETYNSKPFAGTPSITWTRELGTVIAAVMDGGAKAVGFDIVFPTTIEMSEIPFAGETLGAKLRGFDGDFLRVLASGARNGKIILGQIQGEGRPVAPSDAQRLAVGFQKNIRPLNLYRDPDGVIRRVPLAMKVDGLQTPSMALELAARLLSVSTDLNAKRGVLLGERLVSARISHTLAVNFDGGGQEIPTYSLADLRACAEIGNTSFFSRHFEGRAVLVGVVLELEDRSLTSKRFATGTEGNRTGRCTGSTFEQVGAARDTISSVYMHAAAVNNLVRGNELREFSHVPAAALNYSAAALTTIVALSWSLPVAALMLLITAIVWTIGATYGFAHAIAIPVLEPTAAGALALTLSSAYRFFITDKEQRLLRKSFSFYLAPALIERMISSDKPPALGGETRVVTLYRSDLAGFTSLAEQLPPSDVISFMNEYLSAMTDIIDMHGGFVDRYIGDAVDGVFGAPLDDAHHALNAVKAALISQAKLSAMNAEDLPTFMGRKLRQRIGLHTGSALVGNMGSRQRFNYTVVGDAANLASRLEGANKFYGTSIIASEDTMRAAGNEIVWRELDTIRVVGRKQSVTVYEPMGFAVSQTAEQRRFVEEYAEGLRRLRSRDFTGALEVFAPLSHHDAPSSMFRNRALAFMKSPPPPDWPALTVLDSK